MAREIPSRDDRLAARLMRLAGIPLSAEEYARGDDLGLGADAPHGLMPEPRRKTRPILDADGDVDMTALLAELLSACGVDVPDAADDELEFKRQLCSACMAKIRELTGRGSTGTAGNNPNPLVAQVQAGGGGGGNKLEPMYMSLEAMHQQTRAMKERLAADPTPLATTPEGAADAERALGRYMGGR